MTRETKIGLLVGLAFIIVIGILLSDHMTSTTQPPQAALADAAPNVRESVTAPAPVNPGPARVVSVPPITPTNTVLTQGELRPQAPPVAQVVIGGPANQQSGAPIVIRQDAPPVIPTKDTTIPPTEPGTALEQWANTAKPAGPSDAKAQAAAAPAGKQREYVAQAGDSLSRIASKLMGSSSKANRDAIIKANPSLQKNPDIVVEGRKYMIPVAATAAATPAAPATPSTVGPTGIPDTVAVTPHDGKTKPIPVTELVEPLPASASTPAKAGEYWYTVKENDNLWKIANEQLGSGNSWQQIKELNKDVLKGGETVHINMKLRLPAKPLASAN